MRAQLLGQAAGEVQLGGLGRRVGGRSLAGGERVLRADEDDAAAGALLDQHPCRLPGDEEIAAREDVVVAVPQLDRASR